MVASGKRKRPIETANTRPITAFFEKKRATAVSPDVPAQSAHRGASNAVDLVEEIDSEGEDITHHDQDAVTVVASADDDTSNSDSASDLTLLQPHEPQALNTAHLTRIVHRRELGSGARGVPSSSVHRRRQQTEQRLLRWALGQFQLLPLQLALSDDAMRVVAQSHRLATHCGEFFTSCLAFDSQGALLVAGSSNGVIALFDCDELFHRTINLQADPSPLTKKRKALDRDRLTGIPTIPPIHTIFTGMEVQRVRWNPMNEDEIACCFLNRNEIFLYNLQKFPSKPYQVLKAASRPSSGYTDLVFLPSASSVSQSQPGKTTAKKIRTGSIIAGDVDGMLRAWDLRFPTKPQWAVSVGSQPVTALILDHDKRLLICGTEGGVVMTYDVQKLVVPAFGSKPMPQRRAAIRINDAIQPVLSSEAAAFLRYSMRDSATVLAVTAMHAVPTSSSQIVVQLRNEWIVVLDISTGRVVKLHSPIKELPSSLRPPTLPLPATVLHSAGDLPGIGSHQRGPVNGHQRHSWLHLHRCASALMFNGDMVCSGLPDQDALVVVDLHRMDPSRAQRPKPESSWLVRPQDTVDRLSRFRIHIPGLVTAVAVHPTQHWMLCGGADLRIQILGVAGTLHEDGEVLDLLDLPVDSVDTLFNGDNEDE